MTITNERIEKATEAIAKYGICRKVYGCNPIVCECRRAAINALGADAPALAEAEAIGMESLQQYFEGEADEAGRLAGHEHLSEGGNYERGWRHLERAKEMRAIADAIASRISAPQAEIDANG